MDDRDIRYGDHIYITETRKTLSRVHRVNKEISDAIRDRYLLTNEAVAAWRYDGDRGSL